MLDAQIEETSGFPILDQAAILVARNATLSEPPLTADGQPTTAQALADAIWTLPLESVDEYIRVESYTIDPPSPEDVVTYPEPASAPVSSSDYPWVSAWRGEEGSAVVQILVGEDGSVRDAHLASSSGYERLDEASLSMVTRFTYVPSTINGSPTEVWAPQRITWWLPEKSRGSVYDCFDAPHVSAFERRQRVAEGEALPEIERWTLLKQDGDIEAGLILTEQGWMKLAEPLVDAMNQQPGPEADSERPPVCWVYDGLNPMMLD